MSRGRSCTGARSPRRSARARRRAAGRARAPRIARSSSGKIQNGSPALRIEWYFATSSLWAKPGSVMNASAGDDERRTRVRARRVRTPWTARIDERDREPLERVVRERADRREVDDERGERPDADRLVLPDGRGQAVGERGGQRQRRRGSSAIAHQGQLHSRHRARGVGLRRRASRRRRVAEQPGSRARGARPRRRRASAARRRLGRARAAPQPPGRDAHHDQRERRALPRLQPAITTARRARQPSGRGRCVPRQRSRASSTSGIRNTAIAVIR